MTGMPAASNRALARRMCSTSVTRIAVRMPAAFSIGTDRRALSRVSSDWSSIHRTDVRKSRCSESTISPASDAWPPGGRPPLTSNGRWVRGRESRAAAKPGQRHRVDGLAAVVRGTAFEAAAQHDDGRVRRQHRGLGERRIGPLALPRDRVRDDRQREHDEDGHADRDQRETRAPPAALQPESEDDRDQRTRRQQQQSRDDLLRPEREFDHADDEPRSAPAIPARATCASSGDFTPETPTAPTVWPSTTICSPPSSRPCSSGTDRNAKRPLLTTSS